MEQNLKLAGALVDLITLATGLYGFASAGKNLGMKQMARLAMVELTADVTATTVATIGEYQNWPPGLTLLLSLGAGFTVGQIGNHIIFKKNGVEIFRKEITESVPSLTDDSLDAARHLDDVIENNKSNKIGYEYLDDQLGGLKDKVKINQYQSAESVNAWWEARGYKSPYKEKTVVQNITLTEDTKFVRVYDGVNSKLEGGWVMRAEDIKGLTPKEIQAKFALEYEPKFIGEVELKAGDTIRLGEVGPNFGFDGGGIQIDLQQQWIGDFTELGKIEDWR